MKIKLVQCANFGGFSKAVADFESESTFLTGENGAGKTTLLDAINTATTLGSNALPYNAAGTEGKSSHRSIKRDLPSYCLGATEDGFLRRRARMHTIVTYEFEAEDASAGYLHVGCLAEAEVGDDKKARLIGQARGFVWESDLLIPNNWLWTTDSQGNPTPTSAKEFKLNVKADGYEALIKMSEAKNEHMSYLASLITGLSLNEANARKTLLAPTQTLKINPNWDPKSFAREILGSVPLDTTTLEHLGSAAKSFERSTKDLERQEITFDAMKAVEALALRSGNLAADLSVAKAEKAKREEKVILLKHKDLTSRMDLLKTQSLKAIEGKAQSEARRLEISGHVEDLDTQLAEARSGMGIAMLQERQKQASKFYAEVKAMTTPVTVRWNQDKKDIKAHAEAISSFYPKISQGIHSLIDTADLAESLPFDSITAKDQQMQWQTELQEAFKEDGALSLQHQEKQDLMVQLRSEERALDLQVKAGSRDGTQVNMPPKTQFAMKLLKEKMPQAKARCLCNVVKPAPHANLQWVEMFERIMGNARFIIIVESGFEHDAIKLIKDNVNSGIHLTGPVAEVARNDKNAHSANQYLIKGQNRAIDDLLIEDDTEAQNYLNASWAKWQKSETDEQFKQFDFGFCLDGRTANKSTLRAEFSDQKHFNACFGKAAASAAQKKLEMEHQALKAALQKLKAEVDAWDKVKSSAHHLIQISLVELIADRLESLSRFEKAKSDDEQARLEVSRAQEALEIGGKAAQVQELEQKRSQLKQDLDAILEDLHRFTASSADAAARMEEAKRQCENIENQLQDAQRAYRDKELIQQAWLSAVDMSIVGDLSDKTEGMLNRHIEVTSQSLSETVTNWNVQASHFNGMEGRASEDLLQSLSLLSSVDDAKAFAQLKASMNVKIKTAGARCDVQAREKMQQAKNHLEAILRDEICDKALNAQHQIDDEVKRLNQIFKNALFDGTYFELKRTSLEEYKKRLRIYEEIKQATVADGSINWTLLSSHAQETFAHIVSLAQSSDNESHLKLQNICDPVTGSHFEIFSKRRGEAGAEDLQLSNLHEQRTGSGGENQWVYTLLQTLISAAQGGVLGKRKQANAVRIIQMDEAFDKFSITRTEALMQFFENELGLQVLAAVPSGKSANLLKFFSRKVDVIKPSAAGGKGKPRHSQMNLTLLHKPIIHAQIQVSQEQAYKIACESLLSQSDDQTLLDIHQSQHRIESFKAAVSDKGAALNKTAVSDQKDQRLSSESSVDTSGDRLAESLNPDAIYIQETITANEALKDHLQRRHLFEDPAIVIESIQESESDLNTDLDIDVDVDNTLAASSQHNNHHNKDAS